MNTLILSLALLGIDRGNLGRLQTFDPVFTVAINVVFLLQAEHMLPQFTYICFFDWKGRSVHSN